MLSKVRADKICRTKMQTLSPWQDKFMLHVPADSAHASIGYEDYGSSWERERTQAQRATGTALGATHSQANVSQPVSASTLECVKTDAGHFTSDFASSFAHGSAQGQSRDCSGFQRPPGVALPVLTAGESTTHRSVVICSADTEALPVPFSDGISSGAVAAMYLDGTNASATLSPDNGCLVGGRTSGYRPSPRPSLEAAATSRASEPAPIPHPNIACAADRTASPMQQQLLTLFSSSETSSSNSKHLAVPIRAAEAVVTAGAPPSGTVAVHSCPSTSSRLLRPPTQRSAATVRSLQRPASEADRTADRPVAVAAATPGVPMVSPFGRSATVEHQAWLARSGGAVAQHPAGFARAATTLTGADFSGPPGLESCRLTARMPYGRPAAAAVVGGGAVVAPQVPPALPPRLRPEGPFDWGLELTCWDEEEEGGERMGEGAVGTRSQARFEERMACMNREAWRWRAGPVRAVATPAAALGRWLALSAGGGGGWQALTAATAAGGPGRAAAKLAAGMATATAGVGAVQAPRRPSAGRQNPSTPAATAAASLMAELSGQEAAAGWLASLLPRLSRRRSQPPPQPYFPSRSGGGATAPQQPDSAATSPQHLGSDVDGPVAPAAAAGDGDARIPADADSDAALVGLEAAAAAVAAATAAAAAQVSSVAAPPGKRQSMQGFEGSTCGGSGGGAGVLLATMSYVAAEGRQTCGTIAGADVHVAPVAEDEGVGIRRNADKGSCGTVDQQQACLPFPKRRRDGDACPVYGPEEDGEDGRAMVKVRGGGLPHPSLRLELLQSAVDEQLQLQLPAPADSARDRPGRSQHQAVASD